MIYSHIYKGPKKIPESAAYYILALLMEEK